MANIFQVNSQEIEGRGEFGSSVFAGTSGIASRRDEDTRPNARGDGRINRGWLGFPMKDRKSLVQQIQQRKDTLRPF